MAAKVKKNKQARIRRRSKNVCKAPTPARRLPMTRWMAKIIVDKHNSNRKLRTGAKLGWDGRRWVVHIIDPTQQGPAKTFASPEAYEQEHPKVSMPMGDWVEQEEYEEAS